MLLLATLVRPVDIIWRRHFPLGPGLGDGVVHVRIRDYEIIGS